MRHIAYSDRRDFDRSELQDLLLSVGWSSTPSEYLQNLEALCVDGGGSLTGTLFRSGLVDEVSLLVDPCLIGGESPASLFRAPDLESTDEVTRLLLTGVDGLRGDIVWLRYEVRA